MEKIAVVYWSGTGNTEIMANAIADGVKQGGAEVEVFPVSAIDAATASGFNKLCLGCSSMGAEVLEEVEFEPFFTDLESKLGGKKVALFGSYGWGDGQWMREWQERTEATGTSLFEEGLIINETPDADGVSICEEFGKRFAAF